MTPLDSLDTAIFSKAGGRANGDWRKSFLEPERDRLAVLKRGAGPTVGREAGPNGASRTSPPTDGENGEELPDFLNRLPEAIFLFDPAESSGLDPVVQGTEINYGGQPRAFKWSLSWSIQHCNEAACDQSGYTREELIGQPAGLVGPITDQWEILADLPEKLVHEKYVRFEALNCRKDRTLVPVEVSATLVLLGRRPLVLCIERELPRWKLPEVRHEKSGAGSARGGNPVLEFDARGQLTYYNAAANQLALALGQSTPVTLVPPGMSALVQERLGSGSHHLGLETRVGPRVLSWALFPNLSNMTVYAYVSDVTERTRPQMSPPAEPLDFENGARLLAAPARSAEPLPGIVPAESHPARSFGDCASDRWIRYSGDAMIAFDLEERIQCFNPAAERLTGCSAAAVMGRPYPSLNLLTPESLAAMSDVLRQVMAGQEPAPLEQVMLDRAGRRLVVEANFRAVRDGTRIIGVLAILRDATARKLGEERQQLADSSLVLAQRVAKTGSWEWRGGEESLDWSPETFRIFGCDPHQFVPTRSAMLALIHPASRELVKQTAESAWQTGSAYRLEYWIVHREGAQRLVQEEAEVIGDDHGAPVRMIGAIQDITERKQQEEQLRHLEKWEAIGRLAGGVAHDFNNILADIRRCIEVIQASTPDIKDEIAVQLKDLATTAERATSLTWQLLAYSRKPVIQCKPINLNATINRITDTLRRVLGEDIDLQLKLVPELPTVSADTSMMEQVFLNLAIKSRHAMQQGGRLLIETRVAGIDAAYVKQRPDASVGQFVCLGITATGAGLDTAATACIFEPFFTTKQPGQSAGLVLATVYTIIKQHQGWIDVFREVERGATFKIYLPIRDQAVELPAVETTPDLSGGGKETILLVGDEPLLRALAQSILERYGYQILSAGSGPEALNLWEKADHKIDLLLTDVVVSGNLTGQDLARQLQAKKPELKVVFTSGYNVDAIPRDLPLRPGINFIPKPYSASALVQTVRSCLDQELLSRNSPRLKLKAN